MQNASTQGNFKLTTSIEALKEEADAALKHVFQWMLIPMMMKMRWAIYVKALAVKLIGSSLVKQRIV